ncbi:ATP-binding protein [Psychromonas sp. KJ10-10]|uniref:ATP-binding protein n=1 Tax=Psychromonas sp. KJ10-10 TaxID=3391823 RepID=UPI0039B607BC
MHLLQIVREAIVNAIKHAQCENIEISYLITDEHNVWFNIIDDGSGILDNRQQYNHYGLSTMQQRADELGATLSINRLSKGTEVKLMFPYQQSMLTQGMNNE